MSASAKGETLTAVELNALVRFEVAGRFRSVSAGGQRIDDGLAQLYYRTGGAKRAVGADIQRTLIERGLLVRPAAGQCATTAAGRQRICDAINAAKAVRP